MLVQGFAFVDGNGLADSIEAINGDNNGTNPRETIPGTPDYLNADSDADGCSDAAQACCDPCGRCQDDPSACPGLEAPLVVVGYSPCSPVASTTPLSLWIYGNALAEDDLCNP